MLSSSESGQDHEVTDLPEKALVPAAAQVIIFDHGQAVLDVADGAVNLGAQPAQGVQRGERGKVLLGHGVTSGSSGATLTFFFLTPP